MHKKYFIVPNGKYSTTIILPGESHSSLSLSHLGRETCTKVKPLFPYSWHGEWYIYKDSIH